MGSTLALEQGGGNPDLPALSELAMPERKILRNHSREYWYMGSTLARSDTQKKRIWVRTATGMYSMRVRSMSFSVFSAILTLDYGVKKGGTEVRVVRLGQAN